MSRKLSRIAMMKILFAMEHRGEFNDEVMESFFETQWEESEIEKIYNHVFSGKALKRRLEESSESSLDEDEILYCREHIGELIEHLETIDELISNNLKDWTLDRLTIVDLSIIRLAVYEILYCDDIANPVSVNEAVDIAKMFSTKDSARFINGILGSTLRQSNDQTN